MNKPKVIFRADGNAQIGLGHIYRCLALADMLKDSFTGVFATRAATEAVSFQIRAVCEEIYYLDEDAHYQEFLNYLQGDEIVVLDNYFFGPEYQKAIMDRGCKLIHIDDTQPYHYHAHAVINHAPGLSRQMFSLDKHTLLCTGLDYAMLRKPFRVASLDTREFNNGHKYNVFICFGGADFHNVTLKVIQSLIKNPLVDTMHVVLGSANQHSLAISGVVKSFSNIRLYDHLNAEEMLDLMQNCNLAIVPSSTILYELTAARVFTISGYYVDNQKNIYEGFLKEDLIKGVGDFLIYDGYGELVNTINIDQRRNMLRMQQEKLRGDSACNFLKLFNCL